MSEQLVFEARKGARLHKRFQGITHFESGGPMWSDALRRWMPAGAPWDSRETGRSTHAPCRSLKAFKRHLRKHPELCGLEVILVNQFVGFDVIRPKPPVSAS